MESACDQQLIFINEYTVIYMTLLRFLSTQQNTLKVHIHVCKRYSFIETKETVRIGYHGFRYQHEFSGQGRYE
jgi:hypothetical protein